MKNNVLTFQARPNTDTQLRTAIANKRLIGFTYDGHARVAEPHDYGQKNGTDKLLAYQLKKAGESITAWRTLEVSKIQDLVLFDDTFSGSREQPDQSHLAWDVLYARVE